MKHIQEAIGSSFPWLERPEIEQICETLPITQTGTGADVMRAVAMALDQNGLPPTSSLLLNIVGRGSKGTAVQIARDVARARFESAQRKEVGEGSRESAGLDESTIRAMLEEFVEHHRAPTAVNSEIVQLIRGLAGEVNWLKSTIDTERQLRRYQESSGDGAGHQIRPQTPTQERRAIVSQLASSLEKDRFGSQYRETDPADGAQE